jgi:uncharacterized protein YjbI with pentapeptide repeats
VKKSIGFVFASICLLSNNVVAYNQEHYEIAQALSEKNKRGEFSTRKERDLSFTDLKGANLSEFCLSYAIMDAADLEGSNMSDANFDYAYLRYANLQLSDLEGSSFKRVVAYNVDFRSANLKNVSFVGASLAYSKFKDVILCNTNFEDADLFMTRLWLANTKLSKCCTSLFKNKEVKIKIL